MSECRMYVQCMYVYMYVIYVCTYVLYIYCIVLWNIIESRLADWLKKIDVGKVYWTEVAHETQKFQSAIIDRLSGKKFMIEKSIKLRHCY